MGLYNSDHITRPVKMVCNNMGLESYTEYTTINNMGLESILSTPQGIETC